MVKSCCVFECFNKADSKAKDLGISFFRFPQSTGKRQAWVKAVNRKDWKPNAHTYICSRHFANGWHSDDPADENYRPTIFKYKEHAVKSTEAARVLRVSKRNETKNEKDIKELEEWRAEQNKAFTLMCHSYAKSDTALETISSALIDDDTRMYVDYYDDTNVRSVASTASQCDPDPLLTENHELKRKVQELQDELQRTKWSTEKIKGNDGLTRFYTGLPTFAVFMWLFEYLLPKARNMSYWTGAATTATDRQRSSTAWLKMEDQLFAVLLRLKLGLFIQDVADRFQVSVGTYSKYFTTWILLLHAELKCLNVFPSRALVDRTMPKCFLEKYPSVRVIIDCTEIFVQKSSNLLNQSLTFSNYKHHNTFKFLVGITPAGVISFVSEAWGGRASDRHITSQSGLLDLLQPGDSVMADKGFTIEDLLKERHCTLNIPPFMGQQAQFTTEQVKKTQEIAELRIHVERSIGRVKNFHILDGVMPLSLAPIASQIFQVCCWLTNFDTPMVDNTK